MGITVSLETSTGQEYPHHYWGDLKTLANYVMLFSTDGGWEVDAFKQLQNHYGLDLSPLKKYAGQDWGIEDMRDALKGKSDEEIQQYVDQMKEKNLAAWQPPEELERCLGALITKLEEILKPYKDLGIMDSYFTTTPFMRELTLIYKMARWAKEEGIEAVRLFIA